MMKIAVGSTNPTKVEAARRAALRVWSDATVESVAVPSGVSHQPMSDEETIRGAINRAKAALEQCNAQIGIGVEGGVQDTPHGMFVGGWAAVIDGNGTLGIGAGGRVLLPDSIAAALRNGAELGPEMDRFSGLSDVKRSLGAIGVFTDGLVDRTDALEIAITYALARFLTPEYYE